MKTIYYYQTFLGLNKLMKHLQVIDVINVSSIHFDEDKNGRKNIYLNDNLPDDKIFDQMWTETESCSSQGVTIILMVGGAGGAYGNLFKDFSTYYPMLKNLLESKPFIKGVDLDIEEEVTMEQVKMLIRRLKEDFGQDFILTMAPVSSSMDSLEGDTFSKHLDSFSYKELFCSEEGQMISWFNVQCYYSFSFLTYDSIIKNGYPPEKIVMGHESGQFTKETFQNALDTVKKILQEYPTMGGVYDWEYLNAPPDLQDPSFWARLMKRCSEDNS